MLDGPRLRFRVLPRHLEDTGFREIENPQIPCLETQSQSSLSLFGGQGRPSERRTLKSSAQKLKSPDANCGSLT